VIPNADGDLHLARQHAGTCPIRTYPEMVARQTGLVTPVSGAARLMSTPSDSPIPSKESLPVFATLSPEGNLVGHIEWMLTGDSELVMRTLFHQLKPGQWNTPPSRSRTEQVSGAK